MITADQHERAEQTHDEASLNVLRARAVGRFKDRTRAARNIPKAREVRHTMITNAVDSLYRVLETTEAP